tara:strand:+ start:363 stop:962 length:600 start_codon:yes stop_codon:yes gene_type:complete
MENRPTRRFLTKLSQDSPYYLSLPFLWTVSIPGILGLTGSIASANSKIGRGGWSPRAAADWGAGSLLAAREVTIPNEQSTFLEAGQNSRGGFMPGYGLQQRESFLARNLSINFIETVEDIVHGIFTPWMIALGVDGLTNFGLKTDIYVKQYDNQKRLRKGYRFIDAFPTNVEGFVLTQEPEAVYPEKSVTFCFTDYAPL